MKKFFLILSVAILLMSCQKLTVMTYNIHASKGMDKVYDAKRIAAVIKEQAPDFVALQEVDRLTERSGKLDVFAVIKEETAMHGVFMKTFNYQGGEYGNAILSKHPILDSKLYRLPSKQEYEPRLMMMISCLTNKGDTLYFYNTHLDHHRNDSDRPSQMEAIKALLKDKKAKMFLAGDFNCEQDSETLLILEDFFLRAESEEFTYPSDKPDRTIDHIFYSYDQDIKFRKAKVIEETVASDHRPVVAKFYIK
ncbi:MAG: endonuclease/exonuclease/phosphatase family protein [Candidatus Neomarinimicrobiota bacterium]|jgi:endonuclease/exonuclease/phosphatase family metal-dependent hydrolase